MDDIAQMLENEVRRLDRAIASRKKRLAEALSKSAKTTNPRRYVVDITIDANASTAVIAPASASQVIDANSVFYCEQICGTVAAVGTVSINGGTQPAKCSVRPDIPGFFGWLWEVRDTFSDRAWQSLPLPGLMMATGRNSGFVLARPCPLPGGTEVLVTISPYRAASIITGTPTFATITQWVVEVAFDGYEVIQ